MKYRTLGQTGLEVSALAFGGSSLGGAFGDVDEAEGIRAVHAALDGGVNLVDTAPFYGLTKAETVLGKALREVPRERYLLATKVGRYGYKEKDFDFSAERFCRERGENIGKLALQFAVANAEIPTHIVGTASARRIRQNIREADEPPDEELLAEVRAILRPVHNVTWPSGRAENR